MILRLLVKIHPFKLREVPPEIARVKKSPFSSQILIGTFGEVFVKGYNSP